MSISILALIVIALASGVVGVLVPIALLLLDLSKTAVEIRDILKNKS
jgi:hypothetical protein